MLCHGIKFLSFLDNFTGIILHLGNKDHDRSGCFFGSDLIDWDFENCEISLPNFALGETGASQCERYKYEHQIFPQLMRLLLKALKGSPKQCCFYYTEYQFGAKKPEFYGKKISLSDFQFLHNEYGLSWNTLYEICE